ncbi:MAG: HAMP domain-containing histidine kinase [Planctomycetes bacterium]|nr:HAMP domain-containing histidine kinase [Planctomycetota bacterium]
MVLQIRKSRRAGDSGARISGRRWLLPGAIGAGALLLTIFGLLAVKNEADVSNLRARETAREAVVAAAGALEREIGSVASALGRIPFLDNAYRAAERDLSELTVFGVLNSEGKWIYPIRRPRDDIKEPEPGERMQVETFLDEASFQEFTAHSADAAQRAYAKAAEIAKDPRLRASAALARASFELRRGNDNDTERTIATVDELLKTGGAIATARESLPAGALLKLLKIRVNLQKGARDLAADDARELLKNLWSDAPRAGLGLVGEIAELNILNNTEIDAARESMARGARRETLLDAILPRGAELLKLSAAATAIDGDLFILGPPGAEGRVVGIVKLDSFLKHAFPAATALATASGVPVSMSARAGDLADEVLVKNSAGLLRLGLPRNYIINNSAETISSAAFAAMVVALGATIGGGAWALARASHREIEAARAKSEFLAGVTHELKTPLASIRLYGEMLEDGRARDEGKRKEYVRTIGREAERLTNLIDRVLELARLDRPIPMEPAERAATGKIIKDAEAAFAPVAARSNLLVNITISDSETNVLADPAAVVQALVDLLENARKYALSGGSVDVSGRREGADYCIEVADRGPGLPSGDPERLFTMFARGEDDSVRGKSGLGIGLALARRIVEGSGGALTARNREGGGAVFTIRLPVADPAAGGAQS